MRNRITLFCAMLSLTAMGQAQESGHSLGLLSRLRGNNSSTRQQLQNEPVQVAQPANSNQGYRPGVTFPQQAAQQQTTPAPIYPAYPPQVQNMPYNTPPQTAVPTTTPSPGTQTQTGPRSNSNASSSRSRSNDNDNDEKSSSRSSSQSRSSSASNRSSDDDSSSKKSNTSSSSSESKNSSSASEKKSESVDASEKKTGESGSSSALQKIVKRVESGKEDEKSEAKTQEPRKTKEEIEAEKLREAALKSADKATTVVANFLKQANDGYYSKANESLAPAIRKYFESEISAVNGTQKKVLDELTGNGTITMVTYVNTTVRGEGAVVEAELGYENGRTTHRSFDLVELDKEWKIVLPVIDADVQAQKSSAAPRPTPAPEPAAVPPPTPEQAAAAANDVSPLVLAPQIDGSATSVPH